ncbi:hypothetical protein M3Y99_00571100 [Aphelenchoides fujianensis]|nr:hypothetical protein M3Y99_00571100 [Aphelenchoides fujianensis]
MWSARAGFGKEFGTAWRTITGGGGGGGGPPRRPNNNNNRKPDGPTKTIEKKKKDKNKDQKKVKNKDKDQPKTSGWKKRGSGSKRHARKQAAESDSSESSTDEEEVMAVDPPQPQQPTGRSLLASAQPPVRELPGPAPLAAPAFGTTDETPEMRRRRVAQAAEARDRERQIAEHVEAARQLRQATRAEAAEAIRQAQLRDQQADADYQRLLQGIVQDARSSTAPPAGAYTPLAADFNNIAIQNEGVITPERSNSPN